LREVAEVAARFTLDAMPGKQMSIDADLRAGAITQQEATERREIVSKENQLHGAMDGAMKFVKGDAIAGLIITAINITAGVLIARCLIIKDTEGGIWKKAVEVHCLITEDTVAHGKNHEPIHPRRIP
ncbi:MAG: FHIPEP family type III secretion protein, partial [Akkermansiaceae bacterium]